MLTRTFLISSLLFSLTSNAQTATNQIGPTGNIGIGTTAPQYTLHTVANGNTGTESALLWGQYWGAAVGIQNSSSSYYAFSVIGNMNSDGTAASGGYKPLLWVQGNALVGVGTNAPQHTLDVNGDGGFQGAITVSKSDPSIGGQIVISNPAKTAAGAASTWKIYNMTGDYGNSLQFWAYDNTGCTTGGMCANRLTLMDNGNVGIGTESPQSLLAVAGTVTAKEVMVTQTGWSDFVFDPGYSLPSLRGIEAYVREHRHLPGIPATGDIERDGLDLGGLVRTQMQKIEELTLYAIEAEKRADRAEASVTQMQAELEALKAEVDRLKSR